LILPITKALARERSIQNAPLRGGFVCSMWAELQSNLWESEFAVYASRIQLTGKVKSSSFHKQAEGSIRVLAALMALIACGVSSLLSGCASGSLGSVGSTSLVASPSSLNLGDIPMGKSTSATISLVNQGSTSVSLLQLNITGQSFSFSGQNSLPVSIAAGGHYDLSIDFNPTASGPASGQLSIASNNPVSETMLISLSGVGGPVVQAAPALSGFSCTSASMTGMGTEPCTVTISAPAPPNGFSVNVASNNTAVTMPASVLVPANTTSAQFTASVSPVSNAQNTTLTVSAGTITEEFVLTLNGTGLASASFSYAGSPLVSTIMPPNLSTPLSGDFFGMTIHHSATPFPAFPVSTLRFWDVTAWSDIEPSSGEFVWTRMDGTITTGKENGVSDYIFTLGSVPTWASTNPSAPCTGGNGFGACAPPDMTAFDDFVAHVVQRYCGAVKYYETWNEPNNSSYWIGTNSQLLTVAQHLYQVAKDPVNCGCTNGVCSPNGGSNPNQVLLPSISRISPANLGWLDSYLATAGTAYPYADVVAFHGYGATVPEQIVSQLQSLNQTIAPHGLSNLPLWNTEASWGSPPYVDQDQASWLMRYHMALAVSGVSKFIWYAYDNCGWGTLWEAPWCVNPQMPIGQVTAPGQAYAVIEDWLIGAKLANCQVYENGLWVCELERPGGEHAWMIWSSTGDEISVPIPPSSGLTSYRDWQNNLIQLSSGLTVDQMPVLLGNSNP